MQETEVEKSRRGRTTSKILKVMSIFGSVQVVSIICSIVRVKIVALWIGAAGIGLYGIFNSALDMINNICQLGLRSSAVRDLAIAPSGKLPALVQSVRRWAWLLGLGGALLTLCLSVPLSRFAFGDSDHAWGFALLSVTVFLAALTAAEGAVFQGMKRFRKLAVGSLWGAVGGLVVSIPMFWIWRLDSIVPSILAYGICMWLALGLYREKVHAPQPRLGLRESLGLGRQFIVLGAYLTTCEFITSMVSFVFMSWLNHEGSESEVGYFQAGFTIVNRYVGLIFAAIAMEYYPRLSGVIGSRRRASLYVGHEMGVVMLLLIPVVTWFITADKLIVWFLYKKDFLVVLPFVSWAIVGTVLRAFSWCMSFSILAKGDGKAFLWTEALSGVFYLGANMVCYKLWGIAGMGVAYVLWYGLYSVVVGVVYFRKFHLSLSPEAWKLFLTALLITSAAAAVHLYMGWKWSIMIAITASLWSLRQLKINFLRGEGGLRGLLQGKRDR